jgi:outer membrane protein OmpA-like peptidoglycan-associated protein
MRILFFVSLFIFFAGTLSAQADLNTADRYFKLRSYDKALPIYVEAIKEGTDDPMVHYRLALCYSEADATEDKLKAIPHYEFVVSSDIPQFRDQINYSLGELYLWDGQLDKAETTLKEFRKTIKADQKLLKKIDLSLQMVANARKQMEQPREVTVRNLTSTINSNLTEYNPVVSADQGVMAFTKLRPNDGKTRTTDKFIEEIYFTTNNSGAWTDPVLIDIASEYNVGTAGISADGQHMIIFIGGPEGTGDLYQIDKRGNTWTKPAPLGATINSKYLETTGSMTPDGKTIYFASNRPQGLGGMDIYVAHKNDNGEWGPAENLGPTVNTAANEDAPFIHPDKWTLFFTSDGEGSMGGRDIFLTRLFNDAWTTPENLGYPINTTLDDNYFTLSADGRLGFFASDRKGGHGGQDIYSIDMPEEESNIPLTMIKGRILNSETGEPMPTTIYMVDNSSGKKLDFVYQPDPVTGDYLIILPPSGHYDMIIESEGFLPYTLTINVPGQTYFYELYQQIALEEIRQFDVVVGQRVEVRNAFYDTHEEAVADLRKSREARMVQTGEVDVYDLMNDLIAAGDDEAIDYLLELIMAENNIDEIDFREDPRVEVAIRNYYYDESDESKFEQKVVEGKTIFSLPSMEVTEVAAQLKDNANMPATYDITMLKRQATIYFDLDKSNLQTSYHAELDQLMKILEKHADLGVEISGYASPEGNEAYNRELSNNRAIAVLDYFNHKGVVRRRIIAKGYGATNSTKLSNEEARKVEVRIVPLKGAEHILP